MSREKSDWRTRARCVNYDPEIWFPIEMHPRAAEPAKRICAGCEVLDECLEWALSTGQHYGVWGGLSTQERPNVRRRRRRNNQQANIQQGR